MTSRGIKLFISRDADAPCSLNALDFPPPMEVRTGLVGKALSSCYLRTYGGSAVCYICLEQKGETEPQVEVCFSEPLALPIHRSVESAVGSVFSGRMRSTRIRVSFHVVKDGGDLFSCLINSFSVCAVLSGIGVVDTICSGTVYADGGEVRAVGGPGALPLHMVYMVHRRMIAQVHFDGQLDPALIPKATSELVLACARQGELLKARVEEVVMHEISNGSGE